MAQHLEALKKYLASLPPGSVNEPKRVVELLSQCWNELSGDIRESLSFQLPASVTGMKWHRPYLTFDVKQTKIDNGKWTINIDSRKVTTPSDAVFRKILQKESAKTLIAEKITPITLKSWLRKIAEAPSERLDTRELKRKRDTAKYLAHRCFSLAKVIQDAGELPEAELLWPENLPDWRSLPKMLAYYARMWKLASAPPAFYWLPAIPAFIDFVKAITRREHYAEIADLLNAVDESPEFRREPTVKRDAGNLAQTVYRDRKKHDAFMRELEQTAILADKSGISPSEFEITPPPKNR